MILRALLMRHESELKLFSKSARRPGFAQQLSQLLGELQQHQFTPVKLRALAENKNLRPELRHKLHDLALLHESYANWLAENELQDANRLLDFATDALQSEIQSSKFEISNCRPVARRFRRNDAAGTGFARRNPAVLRKRHAHLLPRRIRRDRK